MPPLVALIEIAVLFGPIVLYDFNSPSFSLSDFHPHPFWFPVLLLSLQYGTVSGLLAAAVAVISTAVLGWPEQDIGENHFAYLLRIWLQPVLWIACALVLGQFRMRQIEERQELGRTIVELGTQRAAAVEHATNLRQRCETLERQLASRREIADHSVLASLSALRASTAATVAPMLGHTMDGVLGPCMCSLFMLDTDGLRLVAAHGEGDRSPFADRIDTSETLFRAIAIEGRPLSVLVAGDEQELAGHGYAAVPVLSAAGDRVLGMLKLESAEAAALDERLLPRLSFIAAQLRPMLEGRQAGRRQSLMAALGPALGPPPRARRIWRRLKWQSEAAHAGGDTRKPQKVG